MKLRIEWNTGVCSIKLVQHNRMNDLLLFSNLSSCVAIGNYHKLTLSCKQAHTLVQGPADSEVQIQVNI